MDIIRISAQDGEKIFLVPFLILLINSSQDKCHRKIFRIPFPPQTITPRRKIKPKGGKMRKQESKLGGVAHTGSIFYLPQQNWRIVEQWFFYINWPSYVTWLSLDYGLLCQCPDLEQNTVPVVASENAAVGVPESLWLQSSPQGRPNPQHKSKVL